MPCELVLQIGTDLCFDDSKKPQPSPYDPDPKDFILVIEFHQGALSESSQSTAVWKALSAGAFGVVIT